MLIVESFEDFLSGLNDRMNITTPDGAVNAQFLCLKDLEVAKSLYFLGRAGRGQNYQTMKDALQAVIEQRREELQIGDPKTSLAQRKENQKVIGLLEQKL